MRFLVLGVMFVLLSVGVRISDAQADEAIRLQYGQTVTGRLDARTPQQRYAFDGQRGEYVTIRLRATSGNLDPVILLLDGGGVPLVSRDDSGGGVSPEIRMQRIPSSGQYTLIVGRFGYAHGSTSGEYELVIERTGVSFESGSALRYGDTVVNNINDAQSHVYYSFRAERGDIITVTMRRDSGDLDPYLQIVDRNRRIIAENDDMIGSQDSRIEGLVIEESDSYLIIATRYLNTSGDFFLTLERATHSGVGISPQVAIRLFAGRPAEGEITHDRHTLYYSLQAQRDDIISLRMNRLSGNLDSYLTLTNAGLQPLTSNDDVVAGNQNAQIAEYRIPADGTYYVLASRLDAETGDTTGRFRLEMIAHGNAFDGVLEGTERMVYGTTLAGRVDETNPITLVAFYGAQGDTITAAANRNDGDLLPMLEVLDARFAVLATSDNGGNENTRIDRYTLPATGLYYLRVGSVAEADTSGGFVLVLAQRFD